MKFINDIYNQKKYIFIKYKDGKIEIYKPKNKNYKYLIRGSKSQELQHQMLPSVKILKVVNLTGIFENTKAENVTFFE